MVTGLRGDVTLAETKARVGIGSPASHPMCLKGNLDDMAFLALAREHGVSEATAERIRQATEGGHGISRTGVTSYSPQ